MDYRIVFADADWAPALEGTARLKRVARGGKTFRLVELTPDSRHPEWCVTGHLGFIVEGDLQIEFNGRKDVFHAGDALMIPAGETARHRPRALCERALIFLIEDEA